VRDALRRVARPRRRWAERFDGQFSTFSALYKQMGVAGCPLLHKARLNGAASSACGIDVGIPCVKRASPRPYCPEGRFLKAWTSLVS
jgi:hypothetical protein